MPRGYRRLRVEGCGAGAGERLRALLDALDGRDGGRRRVGEVRQVYDRSAYVELAADVLGGAPSVGPPLVLLAGGGFDGPLAVRLVGDGPGGFAPDGLTAGDPCYLRRAADGRRPTTGVLSVGAALEIELEPSVLGGDEPDTAQVRDLSSLADDPSVRNRAIATLDLLEGTGATDGLGWLSELRGLAAGGRPTGDLEDLIDWWARAMDDDPSSGPPTSILGRGPGATPSGDDVLAGLLVALHRTTDGARRERVRAAGETVVAAAEGRTTTVSAALLAQAARGRASGRIEAAVVDLFAADGWAGDWPATVRAAADVGHTSGVDHLVGALLVPLGIAPSLATSR